MGNSQSSDSTSISSKSNSTTTPPKLQNKYDSPTSSFSSSHRFTTFPTRTQASGVNPTTEERRREVPFPLSSKDSYTLREKVDSGQYLREISTTYNNTVYENSQINPHHHTKDSLNNYHTEDGENSKTTKVSPIRTDGSQTTSASVIQDGVLLYATTQTKGEASFLNPSRVKEQQTHLEVKSQTQHSKPSSTSLYPESVEFKPEVQPSKAPSTERENLFSKQLSPNLNVNFFNSKDKNWTCESIILEASSSSHKDKENNLNKDSYEEGETLSSSNNASLGSRFSEDESSSSSEDNAGLSDSDLFVSLMPKANKEYKEIVTISSGQVLLNEKENHLRRMLNSTFLLEFLADYIFTKTVLITNVYLTDMSDFQSKCQKSFGKVLQYYTGFSFEDKLMEFIECFNFVFDVDEKDNKRISINPSAKNHVDEAYSRLVKELVIFCIEEGNIDVEIIREYIREMFHNEPVARYANVTTEELILLISKYPGELHIDRQRQVHLVENLTINNTKVTETKSVQSEVVAFFQRELQSIPGGLFFKDLPRVLSWKKPELLANLSGRNAQSIFKILAANDLFEAKLNHIRLKTKKSIITYDSTFLKSLAPKSKTRPTTPGFLKYYDLLGYFIPEMDNATPVQKPVLPKKLAQTEDKATSACCMIGTIFSLSSVQGSIWCSPGSNSRTVLVLCTLKTFINGKLVNDLKKVLKVGDKVLFSAFSTCVGGLIKWNAVYLKIGSELSVNKKCSTCAKTKDINNAVNPTNITNGIAASIKNTFFWNVLGKVAAIGDVFMTVECKLSRKSDRQQMNVFCDGATLLLDSEGDVVHDFKSFAIGQMVECDVSIVSVNSELVWAATQVRKYPVKYDKLYRNQKLAYNCEGIVKYHHQGVGGVMVLKSPINKSLECGFASYERGKVWFVKNDFPVAAFDQRLNALDKIIFDAVQGTDGKWKVHLIRKSPRPLVCLPVPEVPESSATGPPAIDVLNFHIAEMNDIRSSLGKIYNLSSKFADDCATNSSSKMSATTQTISTGPVITVFDGVQQIL